MELGQLKYFILTAQLQNMSKAAQMLGIAQPTLSRSISNLERELGTLLFDRVGKNLMLNERGKRFLESTSAAIEELENAADEARSRVADNTVNIGLFCMSEKLMRALSDFVEMCPELLLNIRTLSGSTDRLDTNEFDVLLYPRETLNRRYRGYHAYTERYLLAVRHDDPLAVRETVSVNELRERRLIFVKFDAKEYDDVYRLYKNIAHENATFHICNSYALQRSMISAKHGIGFVPEDNTDSYNANGEIVLIPLADEGFSRDVYIGFKREKYLSEHSRGLISYIINYFNIKIGDT